MHRALVPGVCLLLLAACGRDGGRESGAVAAHSGTCDVAAARVLTAALGARLQQVSLLAPDSIRAESIREAYARLVAPATLERWLALGARAPGRSVSSPWPDRIDVDSVSAAGEGACRVAGAVVYVTSTEVAAGGAAARAPVTLLVRRQPDGRWLIADYVERRGPQANGVPPAEAATVGEPPETPNAGWATDTLRGGAAADAQYGSVLPAPDTVAGNAAPAAHTVNADAAAAADVVRRYYAAITAHRYREAYLLWADSGRASGQSRAEFERGFAATTGVRVAVGTPGRIEGAAGSRYVEIPVTVNATTTSGGRQRFRGGYTLRRSVVDGASPDQRAWRIYSADLRPAS